MSDDDLEAMTVCCRYALRLSLPDVSAWDMIPRDLRVNVDFVETFGGPAIAFRRAVRLFGDAVPR